MPRKLKSNIKKILTTLQFAVEEEKHNKKLFRHHYNKLKKFKFQYCVYRKSIKSNLTILTTVTPTIHLNIK